MVDYIRDNFAVWAKYQNRPMAEGWERFAERTVGVDDNGNVVYKNNEGAQVEGDGDARELYQYDNTFGGIVFGDTGVKTRISVDEWFNLESYDGADSRTILSYAGTAGDNEVPYYDSGDGEWKVGAVPGLASHDHDDDYVNVTGADQMEGPLDITVGGLSVAAGLTVVASGAAISGGLGVLSGDLTVTAGKIETASGNITTLVGDINAVDGHIVFGHDGILRGRNNAEDAYVALLQVSDADNIMVGDVDYGLILQAPTNDFPQMFHHTLYDDLAPFAGLDSWDDGYIPVWVSANYGFAKLNPASLAWDRTLDQDEYILGYDGSTDQTLIGMTVTGSKFGDIDVDALLTGRHINITATGTDKDINLTSTRKITLTTPGNLGDDIEIDADKVALNCMIEFTASSQGIRWHYDADYVNALILDSSDRLNIGDQAEVALVRLYGAATRPQYNDADLALLADAGGGPGTDTDAIHLSEAQEFNEVALVTPATSDRILFEDATDSWNKKYNTIGNLPFSSTSHNHDSVYVNVTGSESMEGPLAITAGGLTLTGGTLVVDGQDIELDGDIVLENNHVISHWNSGKTTAYNTLRLDSSLVLHVGGSGALSGRWQATSIDLDATIYLSGNTLYTENGDLNCGTGDFVGGVGAKLIINTIDFCTLVSGQRIFGQTTGTTWVEGALLKLYRYGYSGSAAPNATTWPTVGSWGIHIDDGNVYLVYQDGGTPVGVQLTALW